MYDSERATMETVRIRFEKQIADHGPDARSTAAEYMTALGAFMDRFNNGPGADSRRMGADIIGRSGLGAQLHRPTRARC